METYRQVIPPGLPALIESTTRVQVEIPKVWLDDVNVVRLRVLDAFTRVHAVDRMHVAELARRSNALPSHKHE